MTWDELLVTLDPYLDETSRSALLALDESERRVVLRDCEVIQKFAAKAARAVLGGD